MKAGNTRIVELHDSYVIKIAKNKNGFKSNYKEVVLSNSLDCFAKVIEYSPDYFYIKMERVEIPSLIKRFQSAKKIRRELKNKNIFVSDVMWYNIGERKDGTPVIFDYGGAIISWSGFLHRIKRMFGVVG